MEKLTGGGKLPAAGFSGLSGKTERDCTDAF